MYISTYVYTHFGIHVHVFFEASLQMLNLEVYWWQVMVEPVMRLFSFQPIKE